jgi:hypothetical protein
MRGLLSIFFLLAGCTTHAVRCDGRLVPINLPDGGAVSGPSDGAEAGAAMKPAPMRSAPPPRRDP